MSFRAIATTAAIAATFATLSACVEKREPIVLTAIPLKQYTPAFQMQAAKELPTVKAIAPNVAEMVVDYGKLRNAVRASQ